MLASPLLGSFCWLLQLRNSCFLLEHGLYMSIIVCKPSGKQLVNSHFVNLCKYMRWKCHTIILLNYFQMFVIHLYFSFKNVPPLLDSVGEGKGGMFWENSIETCTLSRVKQITSPGWMIWPDRCLGLEDPEGWGEDEGGRGNRDGEHM